jgi:alpha-D-ribose 1-methylphosphonate 5-triphosphate synthase subunit PhnG
VSAQHRYQALSRADSDTLEALADEILARGAPVAVTAGPESVSAPLRVGLPGSSDTTVVLGHIALTRCTVLVDGIRGDGVRSGYDLVGAVAAAICDAECERGGPLAPRVGDLCQSADRQRAERNDARAHLVALTTLDQR